MAKRRTAGIQRRERASEDALNRRLDAPSSGMALPDWRLLAIGGVLVVVVAVFLRPDPLLLARALAATPGSTAEGAWGGTGSPARPRAVASAAAIMFVTQLVMVAIMTMTPLHMQHHGFGLAAIGVVIGVHIGAMYLPSLVTGRVIQGAGAGGLVLDGVVKGHQNQCLSSRQGSASLW